MKLSERWLRTWVNPPIATQELAEQLIRAGLEVSSISPAGGPFQSVVVGEIKTVRPHPEAQRLQCCQVEVGKKTVLNIVCGAVNVRPGLKVPVATVGATLPGNVKIQSVKLRGELSEGMICSSQELGLGEGPEGHILELRDTAVLGQDFFEYLELDDSIIDIELTPNRGDCLSIRGVARDLSAINRIPCSFPPKRIPQATIEELVTVDLQEPEACPQYVGRLIRGIQPTAVIPVWMEERLRRSGLRTVHPVVDILNYVMLEIGQPLHAFDYSKIKKNIVVRFAKKGEPFVLLDGKAVKLHKETLIISDVEKPLAIAGVIGGFDSGVTAKTVDIFIESAFFDPISIRRSAKNYAAQTEASYRFERGVDYELQVEAIERATELLLNFVGGKAGPITQVVSKDHLPKPKLIEFQTSQIERILGFSLDTVQIEDILMSLGMELRPVDGGWLVAVPSYRFDLEQEVDLIEEIARIVGYDQIPMTPMQITADMPKESETHQSRSRLAVCLLDRGYCEAITYSFISEEMQNLFMQKGSQKVLRLNNPLAQDMAVMRTSLLPGLMKAVQYNQRRQASRIRLFEIGAVFSSETRSNVQESKLALVASGEAYPEQWGIQSRLVDYYDVKGDVEALIASYGFDWRAGTHPALHPGQTAALYDQQKELVGYLGKLHPKLQKELDLNDPVYCFEIKLSSLQKERLPHYEPISKYPTVRRDLAFLVDQPVPAAELMEVIVKNTDKLLSKVTIFDVYQGKGVEIGKKSIAMGLTFQDPSRTLVDTEIDAIIHRIVAILGHHFNAKLRA